MQRARTRHIAVHHEGPRQPLQARNRADQHAVRRALIIGGRVGLDPARRDPSQLRPLRAFVEEILHKDTARLGMKQGRAVRVEDGESVTVRDHGIGDRQGPQGEVRHRLLLRGDGGHSHHQQKLVSGSREDLFDGERRASIDRVSPSVHDVLEVSAVGHRNRPQGFVVYGRPSHFLGAVGLNPIDILERSENPAGREVTQRALQIVEGSAFTIHLGRQVVERLQLECGLAELGREVLADRLGEGVEPLVGRAVSAGSHVAVEEQATQQEHQG